MSIYALSRTRRYSVNDITAVSYRTEVIDWAIRVGKNGGANPSQNTLLAMSSFYQSLVDTGLDAKIKSCNCFVPDNLIASITPLIKTKGIDPWTNTNFVSADLSGNGLLGNGSNKVLNTGVVPNTDMLNDNNGGLTIYVTVTGTASCLELGAWNSSTFSDHSFDLYGDYSDNNNYFDCYGAGTGRTGPIANTRWTGYLSGNRTASNAVSLYKASSTVAHTSISSTTNVPDNTRPSFSIFCFAVNGGGTASAQSDKRLSFAAIHDGFTSNESSNFFNSIQILRTSLNGGYV